MKRTLLIAAVLATAAALPAYAASDYLLKLDGVKGETRESTAAPTTVQIQPVVAEPMPLPPEPVGASSGAAGQSTPGGTVYPVIKYDVPVARPVPGVEPDEIDYDEDSKNATNFGILLGGPSDGGGSDEEETQGLEKAQELLAAKTKASNAAIESVSFNFEKISLRVKAPLKLFWVIPIDAPATVEVDALARSTVTYPWWSFLAAGRDADTLGAQMVSALARSMQDESQAIQEALR